MKKQIVSNLKQWHENARTHCEELKSTGQELTLLIDFRDFLRAQYFLNDHTNSYAVEARLAHKNLFELVPVIRQVDILIGDRKSLATNQTTQRSTLALLERVAYYQLGVSVRRMLGLPERAQSMGGVTSSSRYGKSLQARLLSAEWVEFHPLLFVELPPPLLDASARYGSLSEALRSDEQQTQAFARKDLLTKILAHMTLTPAETILLTSRLG